MLNSLFIFWLLTIAWALLTHLNAFKSVSKSHGWDWFHEKRVVFFFTSFVLNAVSTNYRVCSCSLVPVPFSCVEHNGNNEIIPTNQDVYPEKPLLARI